MSGAIVCHFCFFGVKVYAGIETYFFGVIANAHVSRVVVVLISGILRIEIIAHSIQHLITVGQSAEFRIIFRIAKVFVTREKGFERIVSQRIQVEARTV